jgi:hypothetical protein
MCVQLNQINPLPTAEVLLRGQSSAIKPHRWEAHTSLASSTLPLSKETTCCLNFTSKDTREPQEVSQGVFQKE